MLSTGSQCVNMQYQDSNLIDLAVISEDDKDAVMQISTVLCLV